MVATAVYDHGTWQREKSQGELAGAWWRNTGDKLLKLLYQRAENLHGVTRMPESTRESKPALPDRLSIDSKSPHFNQAVLTFQIGINFNGVKKTNVEEYCISEGWVRIPAGGKSKDRHGNPMTVKLTGKVEPFYVEEGV